VEVSGSVACDSLEVLWSIASSGHLTNIRVLPFRINDLCYVRHKGLDSTTILCFAMAKPLATDLARETTEFFNVDSEVDTNLGPKLLTHQETIFFDAVDTISGNDQMSQQYPNPNQPDSEMTGNGDDENGAAESQLLKAPRSDDRMGDNAGEHTPEMTGNGDDENGAAESQLLQAPRSDDRMGENGSKHEHNAQTPFDDLGSMNPWADSVENMSLMDMADGGDSELEIAEELTGRKRLFDNAEGSQAQNIKRFKFNVGFQKCSLS
jgi:hypothetical protein